MGINMAMILDWIVGKLASLGLTWQSTLALLCLVLVMLCFAFCINGEGWVW